MCSILFTRKPALSLRYIISACTPVRRNKGRPTPSFWMRDTKKNWSLQNQARQHSFRVLHLETRGAYPNHRQNRVGVPAIRMGRRRTGEKEIGGQNAVPRRLAPVVVPASPQCKAVSSWGNNQLCVGRSAHGTQIPNPHTYSWGTRSTCKWY